MNPERVTGLLDGSAGDTGRNLEAGSSDKWTGKLKRGG